MVFSFFWLLPLRNFMSKTPDTAFPYSAGNAPVKKSVGIMGIDVASEGPLSKKHKASYIFNYRYSTTGLLTAFPYSAGNAPVKKSEFPSTCELREERIPPPISIHGNAPHLLQWRLEDVEIPNPNHFADIATLGGGILSSLLRKRRRFP